jgi:hypothetical protein
MRLAPNPDPTGVSPSDFGPNGSFDPTAQGVPLLSLLAWGVTATAIAGLLIVGIQMSLQLRRGEMGEGATYFRGAFFVMLGCVLATTAGPLVEFVISPFLLR